MDAITLTAQSREVLGKATRRLRVGGQLPAVLYGHGLGARSVTLNRNEFLKVYRAAGESTLVEVAVDGTPPVKAIIQEVQRHPLTGQVAHVDLHQVRMTEKLHTDIPLTFSGEALAVKELGGVLVRNLSAIKVEALPSDLVHEITVDVSALRTFEDAIRVKDLQLPSGITVLEHAPEDVVALVTPPRSEQELAELEAKVDEQAAVEQVEGVKKEEASAEETTEGEPAKPDEK